MKRNKKQRRIMLILILVLAISVGFALLSSTLSINGTAGINKNTWSIHWDSDSIHETEGGVTATMPAQVTDTEEKNIDFAVDLELPGDYYEFTADAINDGTIDGQVETIRITFYEEDGVTPIEEGDLPSDIIYSIKHADGSEIEENEVITANGGTIGYKFRVEFDKNSTSLPGTIVVKPKTEIVPVQKPEETTQPEKTPMDLITGRLCFNGNLPSDFWNDFDETTIETTTVDEKTYVNMKSIVKVGKYLYDKGVYTTYTQTGPTIVFPNGIKSIALPNSPLPVDIAGRSGNAVVGYNDKFVKYAYTVRNGKYYEEGYYNEYGDGPLGEMSGYNSVSVDGEGTVYMFATNKVPVTNGNPTYCSAPNGYVITAYLYSTQPFRYSINTSHNDIYPLNSQWDTVGAAKTVNEATNGIYFAKLATYRYDSISCENGSMAGHDYYLQSYHANPMETLLSTVNPAYYHNNNGTTTSTITTEITAEHVKQATETTTSTVEHGGITGITENINCKNINWSLYEEALYGEFKNQYSDWEHISVGQYDTYYLLG